MVFGMVDESVRIVYAKHIYQIKKIARLHLSCDSYGTLSESTKLLKLLYFNYEY